MRNLHGQSIGGPATWLVWLLVAVALAGCAAQAPEAEPVQATSLLTGRVVDAAIVPIADAQIQAGDMNATSDASGRFTLAGLPDGAHALNVTASGYLGQAVTAHVTDGVGDVRIVLAAMPTDTPYAVISEYEGFIACEAIIAIFLESCDADTGHFGAPDNQIFLAAHDRVPDAVQVEVDWQNTQALGNSLTSTWASCTGGTYCDAYGWTMCQHWGASPMWCRSTVDGGAASGTVGEVHSIGSVGHGRGSGVGIGLLVKADCTVCGDPVAPEAGIGVVLQQKIQTYAWSFYNMEPPEGWVFVTDGPL